MVSEWQEGEGWGGGGRRLVRGGGVGGGGGSIGGGRGIGESLREGRKQRQ